MKYVTLLLGVVFLATAGIANADNCDHPQKGFDGVYCQSKVYMQADHDLGKAYKDLRHRLMPKDKNVLKKTEIKWIKRRDRLCSRTIGQKFFVNIHCATVLTVNRTDFLTQRIRECKATGCQPSKIR